MLACMDRSTTWLRHFFGLGIHPWGVITAAGALACLGTMLGFLGTWAWYLEILSHFRLQYCLGLAFATLLLLIPKHYKTATVFGLTSAVNLAVIAPLYMGRIEQGPLPTNTLRAMLVNVNTASGNVERVGQVIQEYNPDLIVLEEVNDRWIENLHPVTQFYPYAKVQPRPDNFGIGLYSRLPLKKISVVCLGVAEVPSLSALVEAGSEVLTVLAIHTLPPSGERYSQLRNEQLAAIPDLVREATAPVLLLGDLNVSPWSPYFKHLLRDTGLKDSSQGRGVQPTWPADRPVWLIPIDHCLHSQRIIITDKRIGPFVGSDHYPVIVDFALRDPWLHLGVIF